MSAPTTEATRRTRWERVRRSPLTHLALAIVLFALLQGFVIKPFQVPSESMAPTLETGDRIVASRIAYTVSEPGLSDVVVFARPDSWGPRPERGALRTAIGWIGDIVGFGPSNQDALVKRIIGDPGSTVRCCSDQGQVEVNGRVVTEDYVVNDLPFTPGVNDCSTAPASARCFGPIVVPDDSYLVLGDNRANSADSVVACRGVASPSPNCARFVSRSDVIGKVVATIWPFDRARVFTARG